MGLLSVIATLMAGVGFLTFGFTEAVCGRPPNRFHAGNIETGSVIIHGYDYDLSQWKHPKAGSTFDGTTNPLFQGGWNVAGNDASFLFQNTGGSCQNIIKKASNSSITGSGSEVDWYFPCNVFSQHGSSTNSTDYDSDTSCHLSSTARNDLAAISPMGQVYYSWNDVEQSGRNLAVIES